jgi:hypothetical protein
VPCVYLPGPTPAVTTENSPPLPPHGEQVRGSTAQDGCQAGTGLLLNLTNTEHHINNFSCTVKKCIRILSNFCWWGVGCSTVVVTRRRQRPPCVKKFFLSCKDHVFKKLVLLEAATEIVLTEEQVLFLQAADSVELSV